MTADPIRDALREAGEAARDSFACKPCGEPCTLPPCRCADDAAAAAVAAFNRRIAGHFRERGRTHDLATAIELEDIAAAVERGGKGGSR